MRADYPTARPAVQRLSTFVLADMAFAGHPRFMEARDCAALAMVPGKRATFLAIFGTNLALFAFAQSSCAMHQGFK
ncbi:MAG: hypothetical protein AAFW59_07685 [Pseudomonadota bacterium]